MFALDAGAADARHRDERARPRPASSPATRPRQGERTLLNLGHTFGHALEAWAGYSDRLLHGEAVAIGMCLAFRFSEELGYCGRRQRATRRARTSPPSACRRASPTSRATQPDVDALMKLMAQDKKVRDGKLTLILARGIGEAFIARDVAARHGARLPRAARLGAADVPR